MPPLVLDWEADEQRTEAESGAFVPIAFALCKLWKARPCASGAILKPLFHAAADALFTQCIGFQQGDNRALWEAWERMGR